MVRFHGKYTRSQGLRRSYDYDLSVMKAADGFSWEAKVTYGGELKGSPSGIVHVDPIDAEASARARVEAAIEKLDAVRE
jgi:hypothetical protein